MNDLIERLKTDAEWAEGHEWDAPICLRDDLLAAISAVEKLKAYKDTGLEPGEIRALQEGYAKQYESLTFLLVEADVEAQHMRDLLQAEKDGRLVMLDAEKTLALAAVIHGCNTNRRLVGASFVQDIHGLYGGPKTISYYRAIEVVHTLLEALKGGESNA